MGGRFTINHIRVNTNFIHMRISFILYMFRCPRCSNQFHYTSVPLYKSLLFYNGTVVQISFIILYLYTNHCYSIMVPLFKSLLLYICTVAQIIFFLYLYICSNQYYYQSGTFSKLVFFYISTVVQFSRMSLP